MACFESISVFPPCLDEHGMLTEAMRNIQSRTHKLVGSEEGVVVVTSGSAESISKILRPYHKIVASFLEPEQVTAHPGCSVVPIRRSGVRAWNSYLTDPSQSTHAYISAVNEEYGVVSDLPEISSMVKSLSPDTVVVADMSHSMDPLAFRDIAESVDIVLFDGSFCGAPHVGVVWAKDHRDLYNDRSAGNQQFGLRAGHLCSRTCELLSDGLREVLGIDDKQIWDIRDMRTYLEDSVLKIDGVYLNFGDSIRAEHTSNFHIEGVWTKPLVLALRNLGILVSDTVQGNRNTTSCTPLTAYMFEESARYSNIVFKVGRHTSKDDIDDAVETLKRVVDIGAYCLRARPSVMSEE